MSGARRSAPPGVEPLAWSIARTDLVATVPGLLADTLSTQDPIQVLPLPVEMPAYAVKQHWHERYHHDSGHAWLRREVATLFRD